MQTQFDNTAVFQTLDNIIQSAPVTNAAVTTTPANSFSDSDGLVSFVNLSSSFVTSNPAFTTGRNIADMVANFFSTMREKVFLFLQKNPSEVLPDDDQPKNQWDPAVIHYMRKLLVDAGGFAASNTIQEEYSETQTVVEFSTDMIKMIFDAMVLPENLVADATKFIQGVGNSLRIGWDDKSKSYKTCLVGICHEAVQTDNTGNNFIYFPKVKYYYLSVDSSQQEFTSPCVNVQNITFNFKYDYYVGALKATVLDTTTDDYKKFYAFLSKAQDINYKDADNNMNSILGISSAQPENVNGANAFGADFTEFPKVAVQRSSVA